MRKHAYCICENKGAADQCFCFCYIDSTIPPLPKSEISSLQPYSMVVHPCLCGTWSENPKTGFLMMWLFIAVQVPGQMKVRTMKSYRCLVAVSFILARQIHVWKSDVFLTLQ